MTVRPIRLFGDPVLRSVCDPITPGDQRVAGLIDDLLDGVALPGRAGLAANQIGVGQRAFSYNVDNEIGYIINPVIEEVVDESDDALVARGDRIAGAAQNRVPEEPDGPNSQSMLPVMPVEQPADRRRRGRRAHERRRG